MIFPIICLSLTLLISETSCSGPIITEDPSNSSVIEGKTVTFQCAVDLNLTTPANWTLTDANSKEEFVTTNSTLSDGETMAAVIMEDTASGTVFSLILSNILKTWNEGSVKCTVNDGVTIMSTPAFITVYYPPALERMKGPEIKIEGGESFNVTFNITDLGNPPVSLPPNWTVDGSTLENNRVTIIEYGLQFVDVLLDDKGDYKALFANKAGNTTFSFMVNSGFPIQVTMIVMSALLAVTMAILA